jgi:acylphosphatase
MVQSPRLTPAARRLTIRGRVQGVGYRDAAVHAAFECGVQGWVRNGEDGAVEAHVQGEPEAVERFVAWCRRGPPLARVQDIESIDVAVEPTLSGFSRKGWT